MDILMVETTLINNSQPILQNFATLRTAYIVTDRIKQLMSVLW